MLIGLAALLSTASAIDATLFGTARRMVKEYVTKFYRNTLKAAT